MKCTTSPYLNDGCPVNTTQGVLKQLLNPSAKITLYETGDVHRHSHPNIMTRLRATNGLCIDQFEALTHPLPPTGGGEYKILNVRSLLSNGLERQFHIGEEWCIEAKNPKATPKTNTWLCKFYNIRWSHKESFNIGWGSRMQCSYHTDVPRLWWGRKNSKTFKD